GVRGQSERGVEPVLRMGTVVGDDLQRRAVGVAAGGLAGGWLAGVAGVMLVVTAVPGGGHDGALRVTAGGRLLIPRPGCRAAGGGGRVLGAASRTRGTRPTRGTRAPLGMRQPRRAHFSVFSGPRPERSSRSACPSCSG